MIANTSLNLTENFLRLQNFIEKDCRQTFKATEILISLDINNEFMFLFDTHLLSFSSHNQIECCTISNFLDICVLRLKREVA